jgi:hypothetical protein
LGSGTLHPPVPFSPHAQIAPPAYTDIGKTNAEMEIQTETIVLKKYILFFEPLFISFSFFYCFLLFKQKT